MKVIFYSEQCDYCKKLLQYLDKYNIKSLFKLVNIDKTQAPKDIDIVPTIIDTELNQPLKGKKAFEYLLHIKYFNNPTNNIDYIKELPINPDIKEDDKAIKSDTIDLEINNSNTFSIKSDSLINDLFRENDSTTFYESSKKQEIAESSNEMIKLRQIQDKKLQTLLKLRGSTDK
jgi:glutaredoxin